MATPQRGASSQKAPLKGVFPLDHDGECKPIMESLLSCLKENQSRHMPCKVVSKAYLECRMAKKLMQEENLSRMGFEEDDTEYDRLDESSKEQDVSKSKEATGFVAGTHVKVGKDSWTRWLMPWGFREDGGGGGGENKEQEQQKTKA